jgi:uncharacterized protein with GYD domain
MPKFLVQASYTVEGFRGLRKDGASGRRDAVAQAIESLGGKLEAFYFGFGEYDVYVIAELPDNLAAARIGVAVASSGVAKTKTTVLLTTDEVETDEVDQALRGDMSAYRPPGSWSDEHSGTD